MPILLKKAVSIAKNYIIIFYLSIFIHFLNVSWKDKTARFDLPPIIKS